MTAFIHRVFLSNIMLLWWLHWNEDKTVGKFCLNILNGARVSPEHLTSVSELIAVNCKLEELFSEVMWKQTWQKKCFVKFSYSCKQTSIHKTLCFSHKIHVFVLFVKKHILYYKHLFKAIKFWIVLRQI
jgi:hypothetical protein